VTVFAFGALLAALGVGLGAFGAHALSGLPPHALAWWHTATQYLFVAAFGMMLAKLADRGNTFLRSPAVALLAGAVFFSGSLYVMALGGPRRLGIITPVGGLGLILGFLWLAFRAWRRH